MVTKAFGPKRGAGTRIEEQEGEKTITPGALGFAGYAGIMEKGPVGELMLISGGRTQLLKKTGGIIPDSQLPDAAQDFFSHATGAGGLVLIRVTDGNELQALRTLYARNGDVLTPMGQLKAKNGGRWGGKQDNVSKDLDGLGDLTNTTLQLPASIATDFKTDQFKGGFIELDDVANTRYPIIGSTASGLITVASDQTMLTDHSGGGNLRFYITLENEGKALSFIIADGEEDADAEFSIELFVDGGRVKKYGNLHTDPTNKRYWVNVINNDTNNDEVEAIDLFTGAHVANTRPANHYGKSVSLTDTVLTAIIHDFVINSPVGLGDPSFALGTTTNDMIEQKITITMVDATTGNVVSDKFGAMGLMTLGTLFDTATGGGGADKNKWVPPFTVTAGGTPLVAADTLVINYKPFVIDSLIGGGVFPDKVGSKLDRFRIVDNDHKSITVSGGSKMTDVASATDEFMVTAAIEMEDGRDGNADVVDASFELQAWDPDTSPFNNIEGFDLGLVKFSTPGITATAVQKAGRAYAEGKNHQYRYEAAANVLTEQAILTLANDTLGRSDYAVITWPSYANVPDPDPDFAREGRLKSVTQTGAIHGREAAIARDFDGYHKAEAGIDAILNRIVSLPTGDRQLNEELLNPAGIGVIRKKQGNFVLWGDRTLSRDPTWKFKHQREQMSFYEQTLQSSFDFIIFSINDAESDVQGLAALISFFQPEFVKRAIRGNSFQDAAIIRVDEEINTDVTRGAGDKFAEVSLQLADTTERFIIKIGKQGIFESVA